MTTSLSELIGQLRGATCPADIFGQLAGDRSAALKRRYHELILVAHPDHNPGQPVAASQALRELQSWHAQAQWQLAAGAYGLKPRITVVTRQARYTGYAAPWRGDLCDLYPTSAGGEQTLLKIARNPRNNDLLAAEASSLRRIERALGGQPVRAHFPTLIERFELRDMGGVARQGNVLRAEAGYVALADVLRAYPGGVAAADAAWMFNRVLAALGSAHDLGLIHGAVLPTHILIRPEDHNGMLIDWCYSVEAGAALPAISRPYAADYPPEVAAKRPATPATDLYMAARCMLRLLGGSGAGLDLPSSVPKPLRALLRACLLEAPRRRADDAWQLFDDFHAVLGALYGAPAFRPFRMPA